MPNYKIHLATGLILFFMFALLEANLSWYNLILYAAIAIVYTLLPDVDIGNSKLGKFLRISLVILAILFILFNHYLLTILSLGLLLIMLLIKHRGFFHTIRAAFVFSLPLLIYSFDAFIIASCMYLLHLVLDRHFKF